MGDRKRASEKKRKYSKCSTCNGTGDYGEPMGERLFQFFITHDCMGDYADVEMSRSCFIDLVNEFYGAGETASSTPTEDE